MTPESELAAIEAIAGRCALDDGEALKALLIGVLRFLRDRVKLPAIPMEFDQLLESMSDRGPTEMIAFGINTETRTLMMFLVDAESRAAAMGKVRNMMPNLKREKIIDPGSRGKQ